MNKITWFHFFWKLCISILHALNNITIMCEESIVKLISFLEIVGQESPKIAQHLILTLKYFENYVALFFSNSEVIGSLDVFRVQIRCYIIFL